MWECYGTFIWNSDNGRTRYSNSTVTLKKLQTKIASAAQCKISTQLTQGQIKPRLCCCSVQHFSPTQVRSKYWWSQEIHWNRSFWNKTLKKEDKSRCFSNHMSNSININGFYLFPTNKSLFPFMRAVSRPYSASLPSNSKEKPKKISKEKCRN